MEHIYGLAALWVALALLATFAATWLRMSSTLCEIIIGIGAGFIATQYCGDTALGSTEEWLKFLASSGAVILTFLAGAELDPDAIRAKWKEVSVIGLVGFFAPFLGCADLVRFVLQWSAQSSAYAETTINDVDEMEEKVEHHFEEVQKPAIEEAAKAGVPLIMHTRPGHAARALVDYVTEVGGDLLVLGHSGHSSLWGTFLGTTADKVMRHAPCSVLVIR